MDEIIPSWKTEIGLLFDSLALAVVSIDDSCLYLAIRCILTLTVICLASRLRLWSHIVTLDLLICRFTPIAKPEAFVISEASFDYA